MKLINATVYWFDATIISSQEAFNLEEISRIKASNMITAGLLVADTKAHVIIAREFNASTSGDAYRGLALIPRCNITKIVRRKIDG